jgi:hypothetical protein
MIPKKVLAEFNKTFLRNNKISKPEICDIIVPTTVFNMTKEDRLEMVLKINPPPPVPIPETESEEEIILPPEEPKPIVNPMVEKFKQSFYKIHGRYPSEEEIAASLGSLYKEDDTTLPSMKLNNNFGTFTVDTDTEDETEDEASRV